VGAERPRPRGRRRAGKEKEGGKDGDDGRVNVGVVQDLADMDDRGLHVAGNLAGRIYVTGIFSSGTAGMSTTLIGGNVLETGILQVASISEPGNADTFILDGHVEGQVHFLDSLTRNVTVNGSVRGPNSALTVRYCVQVTVTISGDLSFFSSGSLFDPMTGELLDGNGNATGMLNVTGTIGTVRQSA
jgi:hypothetical protein